MRRSTRLARAGAMAVTALALLAAGCGSGGSAKSTSTSAFVPGATDTTAATGSGAGSATPTTRPVRGTATRDDPLAARVFRVDPVARTTAQKEAVKALEGYLDGLVTAFATNDAARSGIRRFTSDGMYQDARRLVTEQVRQGYVLYGPYTFTIDPTNAKSRVAVMDVCINQSGTRRHDARTDKAGRRNDSPYVQLAYTLNFQPGDGWVVTGYEGGKVGSCPA